MSSHLIFLSSAVLIDKKPLNKDNLYIIREWE